MTENMDKPVGILQVAPDLNIGGAQKTCISTANLLAENGYKSYLASSGGCLKKLLDDSVIAIFGNYHSKNPFRILSNAFRLKYLIKTYDIKIVHAHSRAPAWSAWLACKMTQATFITTFHAPYGSHGFFKKIYNRVMLKGQKTIIVSKYIGSFIKECFGKQRHLELIYPEIDTDYYTPQKGDRKQWGLKRTDFVIATTSRLSRQKGHMDLITAIFLLKERKRKQVKYLITGPVKENSSYITILKKLISKLGLDEQVIFTGPLEDVRDIYAIADCFVSPAHSEALGRIIIEAMACQVPTIITNVGAAKELIKNGETGFITPSKYPKRLASKIQKIMLMPAKEKNQMVKKARQHIIDTFSKEIINHKILDFYHKIIKTKN